MITLLTMIALTCANIASDKSACTKSLLECSMSTMGLIKTDYEIRTCILDEVKKGK